MKIKVIASGSGGNMYLIEDRGHQLIVEVGLRFSEIKKAMGFDFSKVDGVLVSHQHEDHSKSMLEIANMGFKIACSKYLAEHKGLQPYRHILLRDQKLTRVGAFSVIAFDVKHDVPTQGFWILTPSGKRILFATDTYYIEYEFKDVNVYMIECNYDKESLKHSVANNRIHQKQYDRICESHMSFETVLKYLNQVETTETDHVMLLHLSSTNSNFEKYSAAVTNLIGCPVTTAQPGVVVDLF